jgi:heme exporter protein C
MFYAIRYLSTKELRFDLRALTMVKLGVIFCVLAAITGSIFAKQTWGSYWNWDPRETSIFMLLLVYGAYLALRTAISDPAVRANLSAVYSILGFVAAIFFVFIMPRMMPGLHPGSPKPTGASEGSIITFSLETASVLIPSILAHFMLLFWVNHVSVTVDELKEGNTDE